MRRLLEPAYGDAGTPIMTVPTADAPSGTRGVGLDLYIVSEIARAYGGGVMLRGGWQPPDATAFEPVPQRESQMTRNRQGFTLIELMIVVAIVAILAAIAISQYQDYVIRSEIAEGASLASGAKASVVEFYGKTGHFPGGSCLGGNASVGLASAASISGTYVSKVYVAGQGCAASLNAGSILTVFSSDAPQRANTAIDTAGLIFEPTTHAGSISWQCKRFLLAGSVILQDKWLPSSCR